MIRLSALSVLICFIAACDDEALSPNSEAGTSNDNVTYDPSTCKTDAEGMVYFALGREVFRRPYQEGMSIRGMSSAEDRAALPPRPDPNEPEGCPGNPLWGRGFSVGYQHQPANPENYPPEMSFRASISFIALSERTQNSSLEAIKWGNQLSWEQSFERVRTEHDSCELLPEGLIDCRVPNRERGREFGSAKFQADPAIYSAPFGRPFTVSCISWPVVARQDCNVSYNYTDGTRIAYEFDLYDLPAAEIISFDKGLRAKIESMRVPNYRWADE
jgi:hypothetical protein